MNNTLLLQQFELLATAPGGVAKLRELILTLAVQGKLVPQDPVDEPASELLKRIRTEKDRLIAEGKIKRDKPLAPIAEDEQPFELPRGWGWVRALELCVLITDGDHQPPPKVDTGIPFLVIGDVRTGVVDFQGASRFVPETYFEKLDWGKQPCIGDILYTTVGSFGIPVPVIDKRAFCFQRHIALFRPAFVELQSYLAIALGTPWVFGQAEKGATGIAQKTVPLSVLRALLLPLPPLPEQTRIVARVEELMRLCDALEAKGRQLAAHHTQLVSTLLGSLTASAAPDEQADDLPTRWQRVAQHFDTLLDRPEAIDALEQTILQLAVRGQLVPQDPTDEPASELLKRIRAEKDRLIAEGKIKRDKPLAPIAEDELPFELPVGWEWVRLGQLAEIKGGKRLPVGHGFSDVKTPHAYIQVTNMKSGTIATENLKYLKPETQAAIRAYTISQHDLYITIAGTIGDVGEVPLECDGMNLTENAAKIIFQILNKRWLREVLSSSVCQSQFIEKTVQQAQPKLALHRISSSLIPLPPLPEQARIVARVEHLRRLCAELRQRLTQSQTTQAALAEALVECV